MSAEPSRDLPPLRSEMENQAPSFAQYRDTVADLRRMALGGEDPKVLMEVAVRSVAATLDVEFCKVLELMPGGDELLVRAGVGWKPGYVGEARVGVDRDAQAAYTLRVGRPVVVSDLQEEERFRGHAVLWDHGVRSGVTVVLQGAEHPYGVLGAHSTRVRTYSAEEAQFVQAVANVLGSAIERWRAEREREDLMERLAAERSRFEAVLRNLPVGVIIAEAPSGRLVMGNDQVERIWRMPFRAVESTEEYSAYQGLHPDGTPLEAHEWPLSRALEGKAVSGEELHFWRGDGSLGVVLASAAPIRADSGEVVAGVVVFDDITDRKESEEVLRESQRQISVLAEELEARVQARTRQVRSLASSLALAEQRERHRVAQILHDDLQQLLYAAQVQLHMAEAAAVGQPAAGERLDGASRMIERAIRVARTLTVDLSPPVLHDEGLFEALQWLATQMRDVHGLTVSVGSDRAPPVAEEEMRVLLFQLVRELLFNVVKHAGVDRARVFLGRDNGCLCIVVEDEGVGFEVRDAAGDAPHEGFGLFSVYERLGLFGGHLDLESAPGKGTRAKITVPVGGDSGAERPS